MSQKSYYTPPSYAVFEEIKAAATMIWLTYDNQFGYVDAKLDVITLLENVSDNWMVMVSMFDSAIKHTIQSIHPPIKNYEIIRTNWPKALRQSNG